MVWPKTKDGDDDSSPAGDGPSPASDSEPSSNEPSSQDSGLSTTTSTSTYPPFPQQAPVLLAYNSSNDTASSPPLANSYEDYYYSIPSAQPRTHHYYPRITHSISATESSTQLPSPPDSDFILSPTPPEQGQQQAPGDPLPQRGGQLFHDSFDHARSASSRLNPPARQYPGLSTSKNDAETFIDDDEDDAALNSILDGVGKMHITMGRDNSGRWRIRRTGDILD